MAKEAVQTNAENFGHFNPRNVYRPEILSIELVGEWNPNDGAINTYRITQNDGKIFDFDVKNGSGGSAGRSVTSVEQIQISTESLGKNIARIKFSDGTYTDVEIRNGAQGETGPQGERGPAGIDSVEASIGTNDPTQAPSVDKDLTEGVLSLTFNNIKGEKGNQGEPAVAVENYVTVEATSGMTLQDVLALLGDGSADTVYRVSNWDGTQYNTNAYTEYGWYDGAFKMLATRTPGIDDEPTAGSQKLVKSGGVAAQIGQLGQQIIKEYRDDEICLVGEYREHNGKIYRCIFPILEPHTWRDSEFEQIVFSSDLLMTLCLGNEYSVYEDEIVANGIDWVESLLVIPAGKWAIIIPDGFTFLTSVFQEDDDPVIYVSVVDGTGIYFVDKSLYNVRAPYVVFNVEQNSSLRIQVRADAGSSGKFILIKEPDTNVLSSIKESYFAKITSIDYSLNALKYYGVLASNLPLQVPEYYTSNNVFAVKIFDKSDVNIGDVLKYRIHLNENFKRGYNAYISLKDENGQELAYYGKGSVAQTAKIYEGEFAIPVNFEYAEFAGTCPGAILDYVCKKDGLIDYGNLIEQLKTDVAEIEGKISVPNVNLAEDVILAGQPIQIFKNDDNNAIPNIDDGLLNHVCVLKINENLYYMYYESMGLNDPILDSSLRLCFAYSTNGYNYIKGFPAGVVEPIPGTNMLLPQGSTHGHVVVKVQDVTYPYRMVACGFSQNESYIPTLWRSTDGIHWEKLRELSSGGNDSPISCIVRGNTLKIFVRSYSPNGNGRTIGIICTDLDGNLYMPQYWNPAKSCISLEDLERQLYQASASILDDKRELLLPTIYNPTTSATSVGCLILDDKNFKELEFDDALINPVQVKGIYVGPGIVNIGLDTFIFYVDLDTDHEHFQLGVTKSRIMMEKIIIY